MSILRVFYKKEGIIVEILGQEWKWNSSRVDFNVPFVESTSSNILL